MSLEIAIKETREGVFLITPSGELNTTTYEKLEKEINPMLTSAAAIVFELKDLTYISSMGLRALFRAKKTMEEKGGSFMLVNPQPQVKLVFETVKILSDNLLASLEEADELLDSFLDKVQKGKIKPYKPQL
ncbi:MAG: STAS domain-containing protein [Candidatus Omnitrophota bacterium]